MGIMKFFYRGQNKLWGQKLALLGKIINVRNFTYIINPQKPPYTKQKFMVTNYNIIAEVDY
jgi:hypothetical protein